MVTLLHGDNTKASFAKLLSLKDAFQGEVVSLDGRTLTPVLLRENIASQSLFDEAKLIVIENPTKTKKLFDEVEIPTSLPVILYEDEKLTTVEVQNLQKKIPTLKVEEFKLDPVVFKFLESLAPKNQKEMLPLWHSYISSEEPEVALVMLARQIRLLLGDEDFDRLPPWQKQRVTTQAKKFTTEELLHFHSKLVEADFKSKTGQSPLTLSETLELLILSL